MLMSLARLLMLLPWSGFARDATVSNIRPDEEVVLFPAWGLKRPEGDGWDVVVRGCVYEPEQRKLSLGALCAVLGVRWDNLSPEEWSTLKERARLFMIDHQRGKWMVVRIGGQTFPIGKTGANGQFQGVIHLEEEAQLERETTLNKSRVVPISVCLPLKDTREFRGKAYLYGGRGVTVLSDIDDTIKVTGVTNRAELLRRTFLERFVPVPGMAAVYAHWRDLGADFGYVSGSPWQLLAPLDRLIEEEGFPPGPLALRNFRWRDRSFLGVFQDPRTYKVDSIRSILKRYPERRFLLVGDSGERDPEAFGELAREFPTRVLGIAIRDVTGEAGDSARYQEAFRNVPAEKCRLFRNPAEVRDFLSKQ